MKIVIDSMTLRGKKTVIEKFSVVGPFEFDAPAEAYENVVDTFGNMMLARQSALMQLQFIVANALRNIGVDIHDD